MVNTNKSLIVIVLDRSGSMNNIRDDTVGGINSFLTEQKKLPGECSLTFVQFDTQYEIIHRNVSLAQVPMLTRDTFVPRGSTALLDAMGRTINTVGAELAALPENQRPGKVFFVTMTDGQENASLEFSRNKVLEMIKHQQEVYSWEFIFLGANQDAIQVGSQYGISPGSSLSCNASSAGIKATYDCLSSKVGDVRLRRSAKVDFDSKDRKDAMKS